MPTSHLPLTEKNLYYLKKRISAPVSTVFKSSKKTVYEEFHEFRLLLQAFCNEVKDFFQNADSVKHMWTTSWTNITSMFNRLAVVLEKDIYPD